MVMAPLDATEMRLAGGGDCPGNSRVWAEGEAEGFGARWGAAGVGVGRGRTWLPSFCQNTAGGGFPVVSHWKVTVWPGGTVWLRGQVMSCGGTDIKGESESQNHRISPAEETPRGSESKCSITQKPSPMSESSVSILPELQQLRAVPTAVPCPNPDPDMILTLAHTLGVPSYRAQ